MNLHLERPEFLWLTLLAIPVVLLGRHSGAMRLRAERNIATTARLIVLAVCVGLLAGIEIVRQHTDLTVIAVVDESESVLRFAKPPADANQPPATAGQPMAGPQSIRPWVRQWVHQTSRGHEPGDRLGLVTYDGGVTVQTLPSAVLATGTDAQTDPTPGTRTGDAVRLAMALFPPDTGKRIVLISDGNDTAEGAADTTALVTVAREALAAGVPIDVLPIEYTVGAEVVVDRVYAPVEARQGQSVPLRVVLRSTSRANGTLFLRHNGKLIDLNQSEPGTGTPVLADQWTSERSATAVDQEPANEQPAGRYVWVRRLDLPVADSGTNDFQAVFEPAPDSGDTIATNNSARTFTLVHGKGQVLFVDGVGGVSGRVLPDILEDHGIELDRLVGQTLPASLEALQRYDGVILQNVPADRVTPAQQQMLARYVNDLGGGLIMVGGPDSFGAGGWANTAVDRILPVECQLPTQTVLPSGALVLVLDRSGSMGSTVAGTVYTQQDLANEAAVLALSTLYPQDWVGVIAFDNSHDWVVKLMVNSDPYSVAEAVKEIQPSGGTSIYPAIKEAYRELNKLSERDAAVKHIVLLTDGHGGGGPFDELAVQIREAGITLSTIGVGDGVSAQLLADLATIGGGTYYHVTDPGNLPQVFIKEARTIRRNLIKEGTFDPQLFRTGSPITAAIGGLPALHGFVLTGPKRDPRVFMPIRGPEGEPIFAHWQVGLGRTAAFTSDATNRWATEWLTWPGYADFWARTVRAVTRPPVGKEFELTTTLRDQKLHLRLDAMSPVDAGEPGAFANFLRVSGAVLQPDGTTAAVTLTQTGPGVYEGFASATMPGNYIASLFAQGPKDSDERRVIFGGVTKPPSGELNFFESNRGLLVQVARMTGGRVLQPAALAGQSLFSRDAVRPSRSIRPIWPQLLLLLVVLFLLDVAARRIVINPRESWTRLVDATHRITRLLQPRQSEAGTTLDALKRRASRVDLDRASDPPATVHPTVKPARDRQSAIPIAQPDTTAPPEESGVADDPPDTTNRLLAAKARAKRQLDERNDSSQP